MERVFCTRGRGEIYRQPHLLTVSVSKIVGDGKHFGEEGHRGDQPAD